MIKYTLTYFIYIKHKNIINAIAHAKTALSPYILGI